jgi:hypothetical protein
MREWGWSWLRSCSVWFHFLTRSSLNLYKLYKLLCNGQNFLPIGQVRFTFTPSFESMYVGRIPIYLEEWGWSWLAFCSLCFCDLSRFSPKLYKLPCNGHNFPSNGQVRMTFTPSFESMHGGRSFIHGRVGLVLVGLLHPCFRYLSRSSPKLYKLLCNGHNLLPIGQVRLTFTPSLGSMYEGRSYIHGIVGLVLVGLLQPLVPLFVQIFTKTI